MRTLRLSLALLCAVFVSALQVAAEGTNDVFAWDSVSKVYAAKVGETTANFAFQITNVSSAPALVNFVRTSCGCTVAKLPATPWKLAPADHGQIDVSVDLRGKFGKITKFITVDTSAGSRLLNVTVDIPGNGPVAGVDPRSKNMQMAMADRQAVFKNDCAKCHVQPAVGKHSEELFQAACGICHEAAHRATMVPDLKALRFPPNKEYWRKWIESGKPGSLMPAFAQAEGGPLTGEQVDSLVEFLTHYYPPRPVRASVTPTRED